MAFLFKDPRSQMPIYCYVNDKHYDDGFDDYTTFNLDQLLYTVIAIWICTKNPWIFMACLPSSRAKITLTLV